MFFRKVFIVVIQQLAVVYEFIEVLKAFLYHRPDKYNKIVMKEGFIPIFSYISRAFYNSLMTLSDK